MERGGGGMETAGTRSGLRRRIVMPLAVTVVAVVGLFVSGIVTLQMQARSRDEMRVQQAVEGLLNYALKSETEKIEGLIRVIGDVPSLRAAYLAKDRDAFLKAAQPIFEDLKTGQNITHFYVHTAEARNFVRVHSPSQFGDQIDRATLHRAQETGRNGSGVEMGASGLFTLRVVVPWRLDGHLIGYLELGEEIDGILGDIRKVEGVDLYALVPKGALRRDEWEAGNRRMGRTIDWEMFPSHALASAPNGVMPIRIIGGLLSASVRAPGAISDHLSTDGRHFRVLLLPLRDAAGQDTARIVVASDVTEQTQALWLVVGGAVGLAAVIALMVGLGFNRTVVRIEQQIATQTAEIGQGASNLAEEVARISTTIAQLTASASEVASTINEVGATVQEVRHIAHVANEKTAGMVEDAQGVRAVAQDGKEAAEHAVEGIRRIHAEMENIAKTTVELGEHTQNIGEIIEAVNDITDQTNLLSVNASIEAAKAGEAGRGFAVVAQEMKSLTDQSKQATAQIKGILGDIQKAASRAVMAAERGGKAVEQGVTLTTTAGDTIGMLENNVSDSSVVAEQIGASSAQQLMGMDQLVTAMENIKTATNQNVDGARQLEVATRSLNDLAQRLSALIRTATW